MRSNVQDPTKPSLSRADGSVAAGKMGLGGATAGPSASRSTVRTVSSAAQAKTAAAQNVAEIKVDVRGLYVSF